MKVLHTSKVPTPKVDVWDRDYGVKYISDPEEDASEENQAVLSEGPAHQAPLPSTNE